MSYLETLIIKYKNKGLIIDTNIFLLLLVGSYDKTKISEFKKTQKYTSQDYEYLIKFLKHFTLLTTPNILSEVTNHSETFNKKTKGKLFEILKTITYASIENYVSSYEVMNNVYFKFGLTDSTIESLSDEYLVLTDDFPLYGYLASKSKYVINFNHLRSDYLLN